LHLLLKLLASPSTHRYPSICTLIIFVKLLVTILRHCDTFVSVLILRQLWRLQPLLSAPDLTIAIRCSMEHPKPAYSKLTRTCCNAETEDRSYLQQSRELHWLPVEARIKFKLAVLTYRTLSTGRPSYLASMLSFYTPSRSLRSMDTRQLTVPRIKTQFAGRAFAHSAPVLWNTLPDNLRSSTNSLATFKKSLKLTSMNMLLAPSHVTCRACDSLSVIAACDIGRVTAEYYYYYYNWVFPSDQILCSELGSWVAGKYTTGSLHTF